MILSLVLQAIVAIGLPLLDQPEAFHISGRVLSDAGAPIRRAIVTVSGGQGRLPVSVITDEFGAFKVDALQAGRYRIVASRAGFVPTEYGALQAGEPGRLLILDSRSGSPDIVLTLLRGSIITGTIRDSRGVPLHEAQVTIVRETAEGLVPQVPALRTDELGRYRAFGLAAGNYLVVARVTTPIIGLLRAADGSVGAFAPTFYPSEHSASSASRIELGVGHERDGVDVVITLVPSGNINGRVAAPAGAELTRAIVTLRSGELLGQNAKTTSLDGSGRFAFSGLTPGEYIVDVQSGTDLFGRTTAFVGGGVVDVNVVLVSGKALRGTVVSGPEMRATRVELSLLAQYGGSSAPFIQSPSQPSITCAAGGAFEFRGLRPGKYKLSARTVAGGAIDALTIDGSDVLDGSFEVRSEAAELTAIVRLVPALASLSGQVIVGPLGNPEDYVLVLFPSEPTLWRHGSRRLVASRPGPDGRFTMPGLVSGRYWLAAVGDFGGAEWQVSSFLERLTAGAMAVVVEPGEALVQNVRIG